MSRSHPGRAPVAAPRELPLRHHAPASTTGSRRRPTDRIEATAILDPQPNSPSSTSPSNHPPRPKSSLPHHPLPPRPPNPAPTAPSRPPINTTPLHRGCVNGGRVRDERVGPDDPGGLEVLRARALG